MPRKFNPEPRVKTIHRTRPNGDIYVIERTVIHDKEKGYDKILGEKLIGKIPKGSEEIVPTRAKRVLPKRVPGEAPDSNAVAVRKNVGLTDILEFAGKESGIDDDLLEAVGAREIALQQKALSIARYWVATEGETLPHIQSWQDFHPLPYPNISEDIYHDLFKELGGRAEISHAYFKARASRMPDKECIALDSTTISTYSEKIADARQGFNKDKDGLDTIKYLSFYALGTRQPIAFTRQPGNIPDVASISNSIERLSWLELNKPVVVMDNGFYSEQNLKELLINKFGFITRLEHRYKWVKKLIDENFDKFNIFENNCDFDSTICGFTVMTTKEFKLKHKYNSKNHKAGEEYTFSRRIYLHFYRNEAALLEKKQALAEKIKSIKNEISNGNFSKLSFSTQKFALKIFGSKQIREKDSKLIVNKDEYEKLIKYLPVFVLVSNSPKFSTFEVLSLYRMRNRQESFFSKDKSRTDGKRPRVQSTVSLDGRFFCQMISLGYLEFLNLKIAEIKLKLIESISENKLGASAISLRKKLLSWIENRSLSEILEWFDCVEMVELYKDGTYPNKRLMRKITTETTARDELFLDLLGMGGYRAKAGG